MYLWDSLTIPTEAIAYALLVATSGAALSGCALLAARLLRQRSAPLRYGVLFAGVVGLLAVPALVGLGFAMQDAFTSVTEEVMRIPAERLPEVLAQPAPAATDSVPQSADIAGMVLTLGWALGILIGLLGLVRGLWKQGRTIVGGAWQAEWWTDERRRLLAQKVGMREFPRVCRSPAAPMPMVIGFWRPRIVLPESAAWSQAQWEAVLLHEAAHIARRDPWAVLAQRLAVIFFWWCPLVHLLSRRLNDLRELICDDYAVDGPCDRLAYAELLVETAERLVNLRPVPVPLALLDSARGGLEERITRLLEKEKRPMTKLSWPGKLLGAVVLVAMCLSITAATAFSQAPPPQKKIQIKIIIDGKEIELNDVNLAALLQGLQPKPKPDAAPEVKMKIKVDGLAFSPDGKMLFRAVGVPGQAGQQKPDPRIEELVKQAEAIKPGSGAAVRKALQGQGVAVWGGMSTGPAPVWGGMSTGPAPTPPAVPKPPAGGKNVYELHTDDGKVLRIVIDQSPSIPAKPGAPNAKTHHKPSEVLQKALDAYRQSQWQMEQAKANLAALEATLKGMEKKNGPATKAVGPMPPGALKPLTPPARINVPGSGLPGPHAPDIADLARQLERISAELQDLRKRLDAQKK